MTTPRLRVHLPRHQWQREGRVLHGHVAERLQHMPIYPASAEAVRDTVPGPLASVALFIVAAVAIAGALVF